jgi:N-acetyltransferase
MDLQPTLEDNLVKLRPLSDADFETLYEVAKDPLIWEQHPEKNRCELPIFKNFFKEAIGSKGAFLIIDKSKNLVMGSSRFKKIEGADNALEIGWTFLSRDYWGGHYNRAVKKLMLDYAFKFVDDVIFYIGKDNIRSQKAVEKIGGIKISELKYRHLVNKDTNNFTFLINRNKWETND